MYKKRLLLFILMLLLAACGGAPIATETPEQAAEIVIVEEAAEPTVAPTAAPTNTALPEPTLPPPATLPPPVVVSDADETEAEATEDVEVDEAEAAEEEAAVEVEVVEEEAAVEEPASNGEAIFVSAPEDFIPAGRNPLTGELVEEPENLQRRPILCKISNSPPEHVRPQSGLNSADIVFEHYAEGVITRFTALFYGETPETVGPVRSARLVDIELPRMYDAALCFSGGSTGQGQFRGVWQLLGDQDYAPRLLRTEWPGYYRTGADKPFEHTFYNRLSEAWEKLEEIGQNDAPEFVTNMAFSSQPPLDKMAAANEVTIRYGNGKGTTVVWEWDAERGQYLRSADGTPVIDEVDGEQVAVSNVIVLKSPHVVNRNICETQGETRCLAFSTELQIWGGGFVSIFRDGHQVNGSWERSDRNANGMMFTFYDQNGDVFPLQIGKSWIQFAPYEYIITPVDVK